MKVEVTFFGEQRSVRRGRRDREGEDGGLVEEDVINIQYMPGRKRNY